MFQNAMQHVRMLTACLYARMYSHLHMFQGGCRKFCADFTAQQWQTGYNKLTAWYHPALDIKSCSHDLAERRRTHDHYTIYVVSSSNAAASVFVSLGKILNLNLLR